MLVKYTRDSDRQWGCKGITVRTIVAHVFGVNCVFRVYKMRKNCFLMGYSA